MSAICGRLGCLSAFIRVYLRLSVRYDYGLAQRGNQLALWAQAAQYGRESLHERFADSNFFVCGGSARSVLGPHAPPYSFRPLYGRGCRSATTATAEHLR